MIILQKVGAGVACAAVFFHYFKVKIGWNSKHEISSGFNILQPPLLGCVDPESDDTLPLSPVRSPDLKFPVLLPSEKAQRECRLPDLKDEAAGFTAEEDVPRP